MHPSIPLLPVRTIGTVAGALILAVCGTHAYATWAAWHAHSVVTDYLAGVPGVTDGDLYAADDAVTNATWISALATIAAGIVFLVWLWRARANADHMSNAAHRLSRGWVIGAWICPLVNLWFPRQLVDDVWRTSRPGVPADQYRVDGLPKSPLVLVWWLSMLGTYVLEFVAKLELYRLPTTAARLLSQLRMAAVYVTIGTVLAVVAAAALITVMRQIARWQVHAPLGAEGLSQQA